MIIVFVSVVPVVGTHAQGVVSSCTGTDCTFNDLINTVVGVINLGFEFAGLVAVAFIAQAGFYYLESAESDKKSRAKQTIIQALAGLGLVFGAHLLVSFLYIALGVKGCFGQWFVFNWPPPACVK